ERRNCNEELEVSGPAITPFCCADGQQAVLWLLRRDTIKLDGRVNPDAEPVAPRIVLPEFTSATYRVIAWDTLIGRHVHNWQQHQEGGKLILKPPPFRTDLAIAVRPV